MSFHAFRENKILAKISESTVYENLDIKPFWIFQHYTGISVMKMGKAPISQYAGLLVCSTTLYV